jgi:hypothetical protein
MMPAQAQVPGLGASPAPAATRGNEPFVADPARRYVPGRRGAPHSAPVEAEDGSRLRHIGEKPVAEIIDGHGRPFEHMPEPASNGPISINLSKSNGPISINLSKLQYCSPKMVTKVTAFRPDDRSGGLTEFARAYLVNDAGTRKR